MRTVILFTLAVCAVLCLPVMASAEAKYYLPQLVDGNYGAGSFKTTLLFLNSTSTATTAIVDLTDDSGKPLAITIGSQTGSRFIVQLAAGASQVLQSSGKGSLVSGAATVTTTTTIGISAVFGLYDAAGKIVAETGVGSAELSSSFVLPVDTTGICNTGVALFDASGGGAAVTLTLRDHGGLQVGTPVSLTLPASSHVARFVCGPGQLFPGMADFKGTLLVQSSAPLASMGLRQTAAPLSYTTLPVTSTDSAVSTLTLAHVADGLFAGGIYRTSILVCNVTAAPARIALAFTDDNGKPLSLTLKGYGTRSSFVFNDVAANGALFLETDGSGPQVTGAAAISSDVPIGGAGVFTILDYKGAFLAETGVGSSQPMTALTLPVDLTASYDTGIALVGTGAATLTFRLLDLAGQSTGESATRALTANGHLGILVSQLFPAVKEFRGSLGVGSTADVAALTLRMSSRPLSYTAFPVVSGSAAGGSRARFSMADTISDQAQSTTLAFSGLAMITGNLESQSFFPPGKVADYTGFQYLRDNDPDDMGHNTSFLTRIANNVISILNESQFAQLKALATAQQAQIDLYGYKRFPLMKAFRHVLNGEIPSGSGGLNLNAVKKASRELYALDGQISFDRAVLYAAIVKSLDPTQKAYLDNMKGKGWKSWPDITDAQIGVRLRGLPQESGVAVMTYASDLFSWYAGSVDADVYFCPERQGTYYGSFYIKDAPAIGHEGYGINEQLTATAGSALSDAAKGYVTAAQARIMTDLVDKQRNNLYASSTSSIVGVRTQIATLLRSLLTTSGSTDAVRSQVLSLSSIYGDLDGENNYHYATAFAQLYQMLSSEQKAKLAALRTSIMSGAYSDGTPFDFSVCTTPFLYSAVITDTSVLAPYVGNTDYLFFEP
jgi:hypothetical protein